LSFSIDNVAVDLVDTPSQFPDEGLMVFNSTSHLTQEVDYQSERPNEIAI
jgi:hypothetical protein